MTYTSFSFRHALGMPEEIVPNLKELGFSYAPIADIASTFGHFSWKTECEKHGLNPVFGVSLYVTPAISAKKPLVDLWQFYATDNVKDIYDLMALAYTQGRSLQRVGFTPLIKYEQIAGLKGIIKIAGHRARLEFMTPESDLYIGVSPACAKGYLDRAHDLGFQFTQSQINRFNKPEDELAWELSCSFNASAQTYPQYILPKSGEEIFHNCTADLKKGSMIEPERPGTLRELCSLGAKKLGIDLGDKAYAERLDHELSVIEKKGFADYFYLANDFLSWARKNMTVGPGRGSSAGSLVCFLLEITFVDPLKFQLLFSRFLDESRPDWPDVDSDVSDRDAAIQYLQNKYGKERVAKLGTIAMWQSTNSTNELAKSLSFPRFEAESVLSIIPDYAAGDSRKDKALAVALEETKEGKAFLEKYPNFEHVKKIVGTPSHAATHASAVVLTQEPLTNFVGVDPVNARTMCDMNEAESLGLLKLDVLGLSTLSVIEETLKLAGLPKDYLEKLTLDDQQAFDVLNRQAFFGVFQFDKTVAGLAKEMKVDRFSDISALLSLGRPGPLSSGAAMRWVKKRRGDLEVNYPHELLKPYLEETFGELIFQEQAMLIAHDVAGMDWASVAKLRKAIGKSQGDAALAVYKIPFITGLQSAGLTEAEASAFWRELMGFGSYGFNKSHAVAYGMVTYWTCYLKAHYIAEFSAATLFFKKETEQQLEILRELANEGVGYLPYDAELSAEKWTVGTKNGKKVLVGPLTLIKGLGVKKVQQILGARARNEPIPDSIRKLLENAKTELDSLHPIRDAIVTLPWRKHVNGTVTKLTDVKAGARGEWLSYNVLGLVSHVEDVDENSDRKQEDRKARGEQPIQPGNPRSLTVKIDSDELKGFFTKVSAKSYQEYKDLVLTLQPGKTIVSLNITMVPEISCGIIKSLSVVGEMP